MHVGINLGIIPRNGVHVCGLQFETLAGTCYHYLSEDVVRAFASDIPPKMLEIAAELGKLNRQAATGLVLPPTTKGLLKP
jgi:hypothetical protein